MKRLASLLFGCAVLASIGSGAPAAAPDTAGLVGHYDGGQMEVGAALDLRADGRFAYQLAYGALDEEAEGRWRADGAGVRLTSDPVTAPVFVTLSTQALSVHRVTVKLDLPAGLDRQYFNARVRLADGRVIERQLGEDGLDLRLAQGQRPVSVCLTLPVYSLESSAAPVPHAVGAVVHFRFDPHDLGKVAFADEPLTASADGLTLRRYDLTLVFRKQAAGAGAE